MLRTLVILTTLLLALPAAFSAASPIGLPDGEHYTLNLIGMDRVMPVPSGDGGHRIFVPLYGECRIDLSEGDFRVTDGNCTEDGRAGFTLPNPDPEGDGVSSYRVYVRALGKPGGEATLNTCKEDQDGTWCSTETVFVARAAGMSPATEVSQEALTVCYENDDGEWVRETIFSDENADYFWKYTNDGLRLAQLRFYRDVPTPINGACPPE